MGVYEGKRVDWPEWRLENNNDERVCNDRSLIVSVHKKCVARPFVDVGKRSEQPERRMENQQILCFIFFLFTSFLIDNGTPSSTTSIHRPFVRINCVLLHISEES
jgi:hypothetical protein